MKTVSAKIILSKFNRGSQWFGLDYNMNLYRGCCHGCIYCDSRSQCYGIEHFDQVAVKENVIEILQSELTKKRKKGVVGIGSMSDSYNSFEKELRVTRQALQLLARFGFGMAMVTKSDLIIRDIDVFTEIKKRAPVICKMTITTFNDTLCKQIEPNVCSSSQRFEALQKLSDSGIYSGIMLMPVLPFITDNDDNIIKIVHQAYECGAKFIYPAFGMTLRGNQRDYYYQQLDSQFPKLKEKYILQFGEDYECPSINHNRLFSIFASECQKMGLVYKMANIIEGYRKSYENNQLKLF